MRLSIRQRFLLLHFSLFLAMCYALFVHRCKNGEVGTWSWTHQAVSGEAGRGPSKGLKNPRERHVPVSKEAEEIVALIRSLPPDEYLTKNQSFFVPRDHVVNKLDPAWLIQAPPCPLNGPSLLVVIPSMDGDKNKRKAIRETWAGPAYGRAWPGRQRPLEGYTVKVVFFLGVSKNSSQQSLFQESSSQQDIVRADFTEAYHNLSLKMSVVLHWVATFCPEARHVIKVDQDTFVNLPLLLDVLELLSAKRSRFVLGRKHRNTKPPVLRSGKWKVSKDDYPFPLFPRYVYGHSYVISGDAIKLLRDVSQRMPVVPNEDAYVTGILPKSANVTRLYSDRFATLWNLSRCSLANNTDISQTGFRNGAVIYQMWDMIKSRKCPSVF